MKKRLWMMGVLATLVTGTTAAQDGYIQQIRSDARNVSKNPDGDRGHYGLWAKDHMWGKKREKPRFESVEDSLQKRREFAQYYSDTYGAFNRKEWETTVMKGDSALMTGFDAPDLYFYIGTGYEQLGEYKQAEEAFRMSKQKGFSGGSLALSEFKKRQKARRKAEKQKGTIH